MRHQLDREEHSVLMVTSAVSRRKETSLERELVKAGAVCEELDELKIMTRRTA